MNMYDPIFIACIFLCVLIFIAILISKIVPKHMHMESSDSAIEKGKFIGSVLGISIGLFMSFYLFKNNFFGLFDIKF